MKREEAKRVTLKKRLLKLIPVYGSYRIEEDLREWDRVIREEAQENLSYGIQVLINLIESALMRRDRELIEASESLREKIKILRENIKTQGAGYFPRFSPIKIDSKVLEKTIDIDSYIVEKTGSIKNNLLAIAENEDPGELISDLRSVTFQIYDVRDLLEDRRDLIRSGLMEE
ncbi:MAG: hypothetical protein ACLFVP_02615 [Candidatus Bathyarchaeia archaeon]